MKLGLLLALAACGHSDDRAAAPPEPPAPQPAARAEPARPADGAPVAFVAAPFSASSETQQLALDAYNFSDRTLALYDIDLDFRDAAGAHVDGKYSKTGHTSFTGGTYVCKPHRWCHFGVELHFVPTAAARANVTLTRAKDADNQLVFPRS